MRRANQYSGFILIAALLAALAGCGSAETAWNGIKDKENALIVDVRSPEEFNAGHVPGAVLIPVGEVESRIEEFGQDKSRPIVVYCKRGIRAARAKSTLEDHGFTNVINGGSYEDMMATRP